MLYLTVHKGQSVQIGNNVTIHIELTTSGAVRIGFDIPRDMSVIRSNAKEVKPTTGEVS